MRLLLGMLLLALVVGSLYADFRWKRWIAARREARERDSRDLPGER
jgi:hypothetical protein